MRVASVSYVYKTADSLFALISPTDETDSIAKKRFDEVIVACNKDVALPDSFLFNSLWKRGVLEEVLGNTEAAKGFYLHSLEMFSQKKTLADSLQFKPLLYAGGIFYAENKFDSTRLMLEKAQLLSEKYRYRDELERLYNLLGALYFEGGTTCKVRTVLKRPCRLTRAKKATS